MGSLCTLDSQMPCPFPTLQPVGFLTCKSATVLPVEKPSDLSILSGSMSRWRSDEKPDPTGPCGPETYYWLVASVELANS